MSSIANTPLNKKKVADTIFEHSRDYLSAKFKLPLGDKCLKKVHTNQFMFTELPKEFRIENWGTIAKALSSDYNRFTGTEYITDRWYIETVNITVDATSNKGEMDIEVNSFASSLSKYSKDYRDLEKEYNNLNNNNTSSNTSATKNNSNATAKTSVINEDWVKKNNVPDSVVKIIKQVCSTSKSDYDNVRAWFNWVDKHIGYSAYTGHQRSIDTVISKGGGNCVDNSRVFRAGCHALGIKCNYIKAYSCCSGSECANHQFNKVYIGNKSYIVDTGRQLASWGSHWGKCSGGQTETSSSW